MATGRTARTGRIAAAGIAVAGVVGLGLLAAPGGAGAAPELPPVTPEDLVSSVLAADPGAFDGTVELDNALGLPVLPGMPQAANGTSSARLWSDGAGRGRVQLPTGSGERTLVSDGTTFWAWNSEDRTVTKAPEGQHTGDGRDAANADPAAAATEALAALRPTSDISVDGTAEVAGRPAYELVLAPAASERTLLREVRVAVDAEHRVPLQLTVLANGSTNPVLQLGFTDVTFGPQDPSLFTFTPPPGATVQDAQRPDGAPEDAQQHEGAAPTIVGDGWDTVVVASKPAQDTTSTPEGAPDLSSLGTPVSGPWGNGRLISTAVANAIITDDGRVAAGAVPEQVLTEALAR
ncbi:sigma-E factor regulatory protein RseB domain-containing protein [Pseudonocardia aurantiaca]|uniref:Outer membrane lipoprotein carrier protein LolA n=1 Tax=Pseudonocardia aurantiaca TaxID=75290 RepID=A0ABW4FSU0_9PSEU